MKISKKKMLYWLLLIGLALTVYINTTQPTNNADKFFQEYFDRIKPFSAIIEEPYKLDMENQFEVMGYKRGFSILGYKARLGKIESMCIRDIVSNKYFRLYLIDNRRQERILLLIHVLENKRVYLYANSDDLANPEYGTRERPIPVFSYKGMDEPIAVTSQSREAIDGMESLEPTQAEFEHNVRCYLTYVMSKEEFNARFKNSKK